MIYRESGNSLVRTAVRTALAGGTVAAAFGVAHAQNAPAPAAAAAPAAQLQEVTVTGSRIATSNPNATSISPVYTVGSDLFQQTGATRIEDVLNQLPQVFADQNSTSINGGNGTEEVDLRGLGAKRTLVLVDGLRMSYGDPTAGGAGADLNMIPTALIDSVEILTGGASSIYGADAVAGVVNFKLNDHFEGVKLVGNVSGYQHDNDNNQNTTTDLLDFNSSTGNDFKEAPSSVWTGAGKQLSFIAGGNFADNKGNATFYATYRNIASALQDLYSQSACTMASGYVAPKGNGNFTCSGSLTSYPGTFLKYAGGTTVDANTVGAGGALLPLSAESRFNYGPLNYMQAPDQNWTAGAFLHYDFNDNVKVYANTMFMRDKTYLQIAPSGDFGDTVDVNCANPFLSSAEVGAWCGGSTAGNVNSGGAGNGLYILRRNVEGGNRDDFEQHTDWREVLGVKGAITDNWTYDASYQYSLVNLDEIYYNDISIAKLNYATDVVEGPNGPECAATAAGITTGLAAGCVPWNIFSPGQVTPAQSGYLETPGTQQGSVTQQIVDVNLTGDLSNYVQLPTAHSGLALAFGTEYRDVRSYTLPDEEFQTGDLAGQGGATLPVAGGIVSRDGYLEARLPIMQDEPFAKSLNFDGSYRYSSYSLNFNTNTFEAGLDWAPTQDVRLRGSFTRAVRAPNVVELFSPQSVDLDGTIDPCAGPTPLYSEAQCANTGVAASRYGHIAANPASQYNGLTGGNPDLKPETALTTSFGVQLTPRWVPHFTASIDYYDIKIEEVIESIGENEILDECASADLFCNLVHRDSTGSLWLTPQGFVTDLLQNVGDLEEKGVDFDLTYTYDAGKFGRVHSEFIGTYIDSYSVTPVSNLANTNYNCAGYYGNTCSNITSGAGGPVFHWRHDWTSTWTTPYQPLDVTLRWRFLGTATLETLSPNPNLSTPGATVANGGVSNTDARIPSFSYFDLSTTYHFTDNLVATVGCNNILDKDFPVIGSDNLPSPPIGNGNTMPGTYDWGGRYLFAEVSVQF